MQADIKTFFTTLVPMLILVLAIDSAAGWAMPSTPSPLRPTSCGGRHPYPSDSARRIVRNGVNRVGPDAADDLHALRASIWRSITEKGFQPVLILSTLNRDSFGLKFFNDNFDHADCVKYGDKYFMLFFDNCSYGNCYRSVGVFDSADYWRLSFWEGLFRYSVYSSVCLLVSLCQMQGFRSGRFLDRFHLQFAYLKNNSYRFHRTILNNIASASIVLWVMYSASLSLASVFMVTFLLGFLW